MGRTGFCDNRLAFRWTDAITLNPNASRPPWAASYLLRRRLGFRLRDLRSGSARGMVRASVAAALFGFAHRHGGHGPSPVKGGLIWLTRPNALELAMDCARHNVDAHALRVSGGHQLNFRLAMGLDAPELLCVAAGDQSRHVSRLPSLGHQRSLDGIL